MKFLEAELASEMQEHEHTMKESMLEIRSLKEELLRNKTESAVLLSTEEKKLRAEESALERALQQKEVGGKESGGSRIRESVVVERGREGMYYVKVEGIVMKTIGTRLG